MKIPWIACAAILSMLPPTALLAAQTPDNRTEANPVVPPSPSPPPAPAEAPPVPSDAAAPSRGLRLTPEVSEPSLSLSGYLQLWATLVEQNENGKTNPLTGEEAADESSGFSFRRARLVTDIGLTSAPLRGRIELRLEGSPGLLDAWVSWKPFGEYLDLRVGQMKVPSTYEVETSSAELDFATRSQFSEQVVDWSLCRGPSMSSPFPGAKCYFRDQGIAARGEAYGLRYHLMVGNGLGANFGIGGPEYKQFIFANNVGAYFYGARLSFDPLVALQDTLGLDFPIRSARIGGHVNWNRHPGMILNDEKTVTDLFRRSWSVDVQVNVLDRVRLTGMTGGGVVDDDIDNDGREDYLYRGWEAKVVAVIFPDTLEVGYRWDVYWDERLGSGDDDRLDTHTLGATYQFAPHVRVQLNYKFKILDSATRPDLQDDILLLALQFAF